MIELDRVIGAGLFDGSISQIGFGASAGMSVPVVGDGGSSFDPAPDQQTAPAPMTFEGHTADIDSIPGQGIWMNGAFTSEADGIIAGTFNNTTKEWNIAGAGTWPATASDVMVLADFTTSGSATPGTTEWAFCLHDQTVNNRIGIIRTTANVVQLLNRRSNVQPTSATGLSGATASTRYRASGKAKTADRVCSVNGANSGTNTGTSGSDGVPNCTRLRHANNNDGTGGAGVTLHRVSVWFGRNKKTTQFSALSFAPDPFEANVSTIFGGMNEPAAATTGNRTLVGCYSNGVSFATIYHDGVSPPHMVDLRRFSAVYGSTSQTDHATPVVLKHSTGVFITAHAGHQANAGVYVTRGTGPLAADQAYLGSALLVSSGSSGGTLSEYTQLYERSTDGRVYLVTKGDSYGWGYFTSDDAGVTWSAFKWILRDPTLAIKNYIKGDWLADNVTLRFVCFPNSAVGGGSEIKIFDFNTSTGKIYSGGAGPSYTQTELHDITNVDPTVGANWNSMTILKEETNVSWTVHNPRWEWGGLAHRQDLNGNTKDHYFMKLTGANPWNPSHWTFSHIAWGGNEIGSQRAGALAHFSARDEATPRVYAGYYDEAEEESVCEVYDANDSTGAEWQKTAEVWRYSGLDSVAGAAMRPFCPQDASANLAVIGCHVVNYDDFNSFSAARLIWPGNY
jgi:hypothetical protein